MKSPEELGIPMSIQIWHDNCMRGIVCWCRGWVRFCEWYGMITPVAVMPDGFLAKSSSLISNRNDG